MREIKFRIWDHEKMVEVEDMDLSHEILSFCHIEHEDIHSFDHLMQYTGLKDKNGKEIYEGDIICEIGADASGNPVKWTHKVCFGIYDNGESYDDRTAGNGWYLKSIPKSYISEFMNIQGFTGEMEVIGNIYENSELIKCDK